MRSATERRLRRDVARRAGCEPGDCQHTHCAYCGRLLVVLWFDAEPIFEVCDGGFAGGAPAHLDHVIPECRNGPTSLDNTVITCPPCNMAKGDSALGDPGFLSYLAERRYDGAVAFHEEFSR